MGGRGAGVVDAQKEEDHHSDEDIGQDAAGVEGQALPGGLGQEAVGVLGIGFLGVVTSQANVAAER